MSTEKIGIELEVMGYSEAMRQMKEIERLTSTFRGKNAVIPLTINGVEQFDTVKNHISNLRKEIRALQAEKEKLTAIKKNSTGLSEEELKAINSEIETLNGKLRTAQNTLNRFATASQNVGRSLKQTFNSVSSQVAHIGSALQSAGNALTRFAAPMQGLLNGTLFAAGYGIMGKISSGISSGFDRYDTMYKFPMMMEALGYNSEQAEASVNKLDQAVRGLPTGLDEIIDMTQRYTLSLGDLEKGTDLAIATNNAFLASMATASQQYQGMLQLQDLMNGKNLTSREWMSLGTSMGAAINAIGKELGYGTDQMGAFREALYGGEIATQDFLNALVAVGTGNGAIAQMAQLSKSTWDAVSRNIGNAFSRMSYHVLQAFDEISEMATGKTLVKYLAEDLIPKIDTIGTQVTDWIKNNKNEILGFIKDLKSLDLMGLLKGYVKGMGSMLQVGRKFIKLFGGHAGSFGRLMGMAAPLGRYLTIIGGLFKGLRHPIAAIATLVRAIAESRGIGGIGGLIGKIFGRGKGGADTIESATLTLGSFKGFLKVLAGVGTVAGSIALIGGAGFVAFKSVKSMIKDLGEIITMISDDSIDWSQAKWVVSGMAAFFGAFTELGFVVGNTGFAGAIKTLKGVGIIGAITTVIAAFADLDTWLVKKAVTNIRDIVSAMDETVTLVNKLPKSPATVVENVKGIVALMNSIYNAFQPNADNWGLTRMEQGDLDDFKKRTGAFAEVLESLNDIAQTIQSLSNVPDLSGAEANIENVLTQISGIYKHAAKVFTTGVGEFEHIDVGSSKDLKKLFGNLTSIIGDVDSIYNTLRQRSWIKFNPDENGNVPLATNLINVIEGIKSIYNKMHWSGMTVKPTKNMATVYDSLLSVFTSIDGIYDLVRQRDWTKKGLDTIWQNLGKAVDSIMTVYGQIQGYLTTGWKGMFFGSINTKASSGMNVVLANLVSVFNSIDSIYEVIRKRDWAKEGLDERFENIKKLAKKIVELKDNFEDINNISIVSASANIDSMTKAIESIKTLAETGKTLDGVDLTTISTTLAELVPQIQDVAKQMSEGFIDGLDFDAMESAMTKGLNKVLNATNGYPAKFRLRARVVADAFKGTLQSELSNITVHTAITVRITNAIVEGVSTVQTAVQSAVDNIRNSYKPANALDEHTGGLIYRAGGGSVFKARGTDTVPAMLTPGEYVQNRHAVRAFGKEFMDRVNALDINGALNALHARFGSQIATSRTSTVNNIVNNNNNSRNTQNVYTNNPKFAKLRSNRYIGSGGVI